MPADSESSLERIGISSADITEIVVMRHITASHDRVNIPDMATATMKMVTDSIDAFVKNELERARAVIACDDVVDEHFDHAKRQLIGYLGRPGADDEYALDLLMIAKYFERIGDHATNIAGWVAFSILGHHVGKYGGRWQSDFGRKSLHKNQKYDIICYGGSA